MKFDLIVYEKEHFDSTPEGARGDANYEWYHDDFPQVVRDRVAALLTEHMDVKHTYVIAAQLNSSSTNAKLQYDRYRRKKKCMFRVVSSYGAVKTQECVFYLSIHSIVSTDAKKKECTYFTHTHVVFKINNTGELVEDRASN